MDIEGTGFLIERCRSGSLEAFEQLVALYENKIYGLCLHLTGNRDDAQDLAQEAFIRLYKSLPGFKGQSAFSTWFYRIIVNLWTNETRRRSRQRTVSLDTSLETGEGNLQRDLPDQESPGPQEALEEKEERERVWQAISSLSEEHKSVVVLREMHDMPYGEIARALNCSEGTVKSRLNRARKNLARLLSGKQE